MHIGFALSLSLHTIGGKKKLMCAMLRSIQESVRRGNSQPLRRGYSSESAPERKVAVLVPPAASALYDIAAPPVSPPMLATSTPDLRVAGFMGEEQLGQALEGCDIVIIPAGVPGTHDDLFNINAGIVKSLCTAIAKYCPQAFVSMISNPVNSTVPIGAEVFKKAGTYDEKKLFGVTTLDVVRAKTFYAGKVKVPVEGVSATPEVNNLSDEDGGTEVVEAKAGKGSATLSMASVWADTHLFVLWVLRYTGICMHYAGAIFADACLKGLDGVPDVVGCTFVQSSITELPFFASKVRLGKNGMEEVLDLGTLSDYEKQGLESLKPKLKASVEKGIKFANQS
ncbi:unnamed protein product [Camellia sinensis]